MPEFLRKVKLNSFITSLLYALVGLLLLVWPELSASVLCTVVGLVLIFCGILSILPSLFSRDGSVYSGGHLLFGVVLTAVGIWIMTRPELISVIIPRVIGVIICIHGLSDIDSAVKLHRHGARWSAALFLAIVTLALGAVLVFYPFGVFSTVVRIIGAFLLYDGASDFWIASRVSRAVKQAAKDAQTQANAVDVDFKDVE